MKVLTNFSDTMKYKDGRQNSQPDKVSRIVSITILLVVLCGVSFYLGGAFCSEKNRFEGKDIKDVKKAVPGPKELIVTPLQIKEVAFPECSLDYQDYTPCTDPKRWKKYGTHRLTFMERHCPPVFERKEC
ncbi:probable methyltransferase PMT20 [Carica papaya]|uniref:probable methyltransferase PMT20 n=1 Tax=Carica papaya TaxID=3649 RepID=UPI000B8C8D47|nr:probable methyltransferase PMT20 [Carica papaya]